MQKIACPDCGNKYGQVALHWNRSDCEWPTFSDEQLELMRGLLLGDADIKAGTNGSIFRLRMTNKRFLEWVSSKLAPLSRGVFLSERSKQQKETALRNGLQGVSSDSDFSDLYGIRTVTHQQINQLQEWYEEGKKRYPDTMTQEMLRMWYVTDGWNQKGRMRIRCCQQKDHSERVLSMLSSIGADATFDTSAGVVRIPADYSEMFFFETSPPPGFEYKWENIYQNRSEKSSS